ncbi:MULTISPECIES: carbohydrate kinase family protein [unclassified Janthinobacterium]|uniref:carbohydrate kinase family protein n=1 Tax=unclassified Janthinobacterium TaxID=2610881 RepID=UPI00034CE4F1|nr:MULTISPECIES: carbohydrate kinase family protein [unclassified Janthinobacterium]MEC5163191.1 sugar/nucleoside kinase (ribokinase family) [Janthinobacterium sp. CG_S6]
MTTSHDVLVVGGVGIDTIVQVPSLTLPAADSLHVPAIRDYVAHTGNGVALGCLALQLRTKFIDFIGADRQAELILARYQERGLDFSHLVHDSGTRRSVNLIDPQGRRLSMYDGRHPYELRMPREFYLPHLSAARHAHLSIMHWVRELYDDAQALGVSTSTDLHDWDGENPYHLDFALRSELVFVGAAALGERVGGVMARILRDGRARAVVAMAGERGSYLLARGDEAPRHFPCAPLPRPVVDSNGAGDSFVAAFLAAWLRGAPLELAMRHGAVGGAFACGWHGTHERFIEPHELALQVA